MSDQNPDDTDVNVGGKATLSAPLKRAKSIKAAKPIDDQLSLFSDAVPATLEVADQRVQIDPVPGIETSGEGDQDRNAESVPLTASVDHAGLMERFPSLKAYQENRPGTIRARLVLMLNDCLIEGHVPRSYDHSKINRKFFANAIGANDASVVCEVELLSAYEAILSEVEPIDTVNTRFGARITKAAKAELSESTLEILARYPKLFIHQFYPADGNAGRLVELLNGQILSDSIERSRGGKLSRLWLTERLGIMKTAINPYLEVVEDYEKAIGGVESVHEAKIPEMRKWLDSCMADGTLGIRDGKLARLQLYGQFDMPKNSLVLLRYPRIAALIEEYDGLIVSSGYQPKDAATKLDELRALLADGPEINKDGLTISRQALDKALGLPLNTTQRSPYNELVSEAEKSLRESVENDPLTSVACGRIFKFGGLVTHGWTVSFAKRIKESFERFHRSKSKDAAKSSYLATLDLLDFVSSSTSSACASVRQGMIAGVQMKSLERDWTMATQEYRDHIGSRYENKQSANQKLSSTNKLLRNFGNDGVLPPHTLNFIQFREDNATHLRSVAEITPDSGTKATKPHVDEYLKFAMSMLTQAAVAYEIDVSPGDQSDFNKVLRTELNRADFKAAENPAAVILRVLDRRLGLLEDAAIAIVEAGKTEWEYGQSLLARGTDPGDDWSKIVNMGEINKFERGQLLRKYFPHQGDDREQGIANLLTVVVNRYESQYPSNVTEGRPEGQFFQKRALEFGGAKSLQAYITPRQSAVAAVNTLYLLASGSNVSVGREMHYESIETSEEPKHSKVTGYKSRAGGKPIFVTLEDKSPAILGMRWLQKACETARSFAGDDTLQLFVSRASQGPGFKMIEEWTYRAEFKAMVASIPELADLPLTPNMLRPSILLRAVLQSDGRTRLSMALGQHGAGVHNGYTDKMPTRLMRDLDVRRFMNSMETVLVRRVDEAFEFLGLDEAGFERRVEAVMKTGLGTMCADRHGRPGNDGEICTSVDCWNDCPQLLVIARARDIAILQIWQYSLRAVEGEWIADRPERWAAVWLPWLAFVDAVEIKMRQPAFLGVWRDATKLADQFKAHPNFKPIRLS